MRLRTRFLAVLAVVAALLASTAFAGVTLYKQSVVEQHRGAVAEHGDAVATSLDAKLESKRRLVRLWTRNDEVRVGDRATRRAALRSFVNATAFGGASVVRANGTMTALVTEGLSADRRRALEGSEFGHRRYVRRALGGDVSVNGPVDADTGNDVVVVSAPIRRNGTVVAALNAAIHLSDGDFLSAVHRTHAPEVGVRVAATGETLYTSGWRAGEDPIVVTERLDATGWTVSVARSRSEIRRHTRLLTALQFGSLFFVLAVFAAFSEWLYRRTIRHLGTLREGLDALESGDYSTSVELGDSEEWSEIQSKLETVSGALERRESQARVLNRVLRHNLRNSMAVVKGSVSEVERRSDDPVVERETERIRQRVGSLLALADNARTIETSLRGELLGRDPTAVADVAEDVAVRLREEYPAATVEVDVPEDAVVAAGDGLPVLLDELCRNAVRHNPAPESACRVSITGERTADRVEVVVADNGAGLPDFEQELLTGDVAETPTRHGQGLGLWLAQWVVEKLDGSISITAADADGTAVTVTLPRETDA